MIGLFVSIDDSVAQRADDLAKKVEKMKNEAFYLNLKKRLEGENEDMKQTKLLAEEKEALEKEVARAEDDAMDLRSEVRSLERDLSKAKDDIVRAQRVDSSAIKDRAEQVKAEALEQFSKDVVAWAQRNSTLAFPAEVLVKNEKLTLMDRSQKVKQPVNIGEAVRALRFHPSSQGYLIVGQLNSDKLLAVSKIGNLNFTEALASKYANHMNLMGKSVYNPYSKKSLSSSGPDSFIFADPSTPFGRKCQPAEHSIKK